MSDTPPVPIQIPSPETETRVTRPVVINRGRRRRKLITQLKRGEGDLWAEVADTVREVVAQLGPESHGKVVVPVVVIYRKKNKSKRSGLPSPFVA
jgi:ribosomal protein L14